MAKKKQSDFPLKGTLVDADQIMILDSETGDPTLQNKRVEYSTITAGTIAEGDWVPVEPNVTISVNQAYYLRQGRLITVQFDVDWPVTSDTNTATLGGFTTEMEPYTNVPETTTFYIGQLWYFDAGVFTNSVTSDVCQVTSSAEGSFFFRSDGATTADAWLTNDKLSNKRVIGTITYITES